MDLLECEIDELKRRSIDFNGFVSKKVQLRYLDGKPNPKPLELLENCWKIVRKIRFNKEDVEIIAECHIDKLREQSQDLSKKLFGTSYYLRFFFDVVFASSGRTFKFEVDMKKKCDGSKKKSVPYGFFKFDRVPFFYRIEENRNDFLEMIDNSMLMMFGNPVNINNNTFP